MKNRIKITVLSILLIVSFNLHANSEDNIVQQTITEYMKKNNISGVAVELIIDGKSHSYYFGYANQEKKIPVTKNTIFEIGSLSKIITSLLLAEQSDIAKMNLDDPVKQYLHDLPDAFEYVTLEDLATHTSGLPFNLPDTIQTQAQLKKYLMKWSTPIEPIEKWEYSNFGIGLLGLAIESATHKHFNELYLKDIASPLHMQAIGIHVPVSLQRYYAQGYDENGHLVKPSSKGLFASSGGIKASAGDMQLFLSAAIGLPNTPTKIFYPMRLTQTAYVELDDKKQGLAWEIHAISPQTIAALRNPLDMKHVPHAIINIDETKTYNGNTLIDKTGATEGFRAYIAVIPNKKSGIVILANKSSIDSEIVKVGRDILFTLIQFETDENKP